MNEIRFKFIVSEWANYYFFVQNLSCWHYSSLESYNRKWRDQLSGFSKKDEELLKKFAEIRKSEPPSNSVFEKAFYLSTEPLSMLEQSLNEKDFIDIKNIFEEFRPHFETIYKIEEQKLIKWQIELEKINTLNQNGGIEKSLQIFYNEKIKQKKQLKVFLLLAPDGHSGSFVLDNTITQELSSFPIDKKNQIIATIWHETIHAYFDKFYFKELVNNFNPDEDLQRKLKEITASSLFPLGYLGHKYFGLKITDNIYRRYNINSAKTKQIIDLTREYIENRLIIDNNFLNNLISIIK